MRISQTEQTKTGPRPACAESQIPLPAGDQFVAIRQCFLKAAKGDACAAALLNVLRYVYDVRYREGEPEWFQRTSDWWVESLQRLYSKPTIRKAFGLLSKLGYVEIETAEGSQSGHWYRLNLDVLVPAINAPTPQEISATPPSVSGTPQNLSGSHVYSSHALDPSPDPFPDQQQQADLELTDSPSETQTPPAAAVEGFRYPKTLGTIQQRFPTAAPGHKWAEDCDSSGFCDEEISKTILEGGGPWRIEPKAETPVLVVQEAVGRLRMDRRAAEQEQRAAASTAQEVAGATGPAPAMTAPEPLAEPQRESRQSEADRWLRAKLRGPDEDACGECTGSWLVVFADGDRRCAYCALGDLSRFNRALLHEHERRTQELGGRGTWTPCPSPWPRP